MSNFGKSLRDHTEEEIQNGIDNIWPPNYGVLGSYELMRRLTVENSKSSQRYARWSLGISIVAIVISIALATVQVLVSAPYNESCNIATTQTGKVTDCSYSLKLNYFGTHEWTSHHVETYFSTTTFDLMKPGGLLNLNLISTTTSK